MMRYPALLLALGTTSLAAQQTPPMAPTAPAAPAAPAAAAAHPMAGTWRLDFAVGVGPSGPIKATGTLTLALKGDSLIGEILNDKNPRAPADMPAPKPVRVAAKAEKGELTFVTTNSAMARSPEGESTATVYSTWNLKLKGDSLSGTVAREIEMLGGKARQDPVPVSGVRNKG